MILILVRSFTTMLRMITPETSRQSARRIFPCGARVTASRHFVSGTSRWPWRPTAARSRSKPWGIPEATSAKPKSRRGSQRSLSSVPTSRQLIYILPEDFGGHVTSGPASLWSLQELRSLHGRYDASRGATFLCRIARADTKRPLGIFTHLVGYKKPLHLVGQISKDTGQLYINRNPVDALHHIPLALESPPTRSFTHT